MSFVDSKVESGHERNCGTTDYYTYEKNIIGMECSVILDIRK
jgi:hypothetical protein